MSSSWSGIRHFTAQEFASPDTGEANMDMGFVTWLDTARAKAGVPFRITSGFRSEEHNRKVGGSPTSSHLRGLAADIAAPDGAARMQIMQALVAVGFRRIGVGQNFIHVDSDQTKPDAMWLYPAARGAA